MPNVRQRLCRIEVQRITDFLAVLDTGCARFAACYARETFDEPFDQVLAPFSDAQLEVFCAAMQAWRGQGTGAGLPLPTLEALIVAFRHHNTGARS